MEVIRRWQEVQGAEMGTKREGSGLRAQTLAGGFSQLHCCHGPGAAVPVCRQGCAARLLCCRTRRLEPGPPPAPPREERMPGQKRSMGWGGGPPCHLLHNTCCPEEGRFQVLVPHNYSPPPEDPRTSPSGNVNTFTPNPVTYFPSPWEAALVPLKSYLISGQGESREEGIFQRTPC